MGCADGLHRTETPQPIGYDGGRRRDRALGLAARALPAQVGIVDLHPDVEQAIVFADAHDLHDQPPSWSSRAATNSFATRFMPSGRLFTRQKSTARYSSNTCVGF